MEGLDEELITKALVLEVRTHAATRRLAAVIEDFIVEVL